METRKLRRCKLIGRRAGSDEETKEKELERVFRGCLGGGGLSVNDLAGVIFRNVKLYR